RSHIKTRTVSACHLVLLRQQKPRQHDGAPWPDQGRKARRKLTQRAGKDVRNERVRCAGQSIGRLMYPDALTQAVGLRIGVRRQQRLGIDVEAMSFAGTEL